ncbi:MAG: hypothetical protein KC636_12795 [Myxococcales bacterium]|nr:hypothetical protein [Myxococcales bacterium]
MARADASTRFVVVVAMVMAFVVAVLAFVLFMLFGGARPVFSGPDVEIADDGTPVLTCREGEYQDQCPDGMLCVGTRCVPDAPLAQCSDGELCRYCECDAPRSCVRGHCVAPEQATEIASVPACEDPKVQEALRVLVAQCKKRGSNTLEGCEPSDWHDFAMADERFDTIMAAFPERVSVHFPLGKPSRWKPWWPREETLTAYREQLAEHRDALRDAKVIFMIGRASPEGTPDVNYRTALMRMDEVRRMMGGLFEGESDVLGTKIKQFTLGDSKPIEPQFFRSFYANRHVTWDEGSRRQLQGLLASPGELSREERQWLFDTINRVVLVVPVPCDGTEGSLAARSGLAEEGAG